MIGRELERQRIVTFLSGLPTRGSTLLVTGASGIGKSALLAFARREAETRGVTVLWTASAVPESGLRYAALHRLLLPLRSRVCALSVSEQAELGSLFGGGDPSIGPERLAAAVLSLLDTVDGTVLACVDDLDRVDRDSRDVIVEMVAGCGWRRVGLILAESSDAGRGPSVDGADVLPVTALSDAESRRLVRLRRGVVGHAEQELVLAAARGNPLALAELTLPGAEDGDTAGFGMPSAGAALAHAHAHRFAAFSDGARVVALAAALSVDTAADTVLRAGGALLGTVEAARLSLDEAVSHGIPTVRSGVILFPDPLARVAITGLEPTTRRVDAHAALGAVTRDPRRAAWHLAQATLGRDERLALHLEEFAASSDTAVNVLAALAALRRAAVLSPDRRKRAVRLLRAAELAWEHGLTKQAARCVRESDASDLGAVDAARLLWVHELLADHAGVQRDRIAELCSAAREAAVQDRALAAELLHAAARRCWWQTVGGAERRLVRDTMTELGLTGDEPHALAVSALTTCPSRRTAHVRAERVGPNRASEVTPDDLDPVACRLLGQATALTGDLERSRGLLQEAAARNRATGRYGLLPQILVPLAMGGVWRSREWDSVLAEAEEGRTIAEATSQPRWVALADGAAGLVKALRGDDEGALAHAASAEAAALRLRQPRQFGLAVLTRALTSTGAGRFADAYRQLLPLFDDPAMSHPYEQGHALAFLAEAALPVGEADAARVVVERLAESASTGPTCLLTRQVAFARAVLAPDDRAEGYYERALGAGSGDWPLLHAMTNLGYGTWLRRRRRVAESRTPLRAAAATFAALGAQAHGDRALAELRASGAAAGTSCEAAELVLLLSPQERTIAGLVAEGLSNRAIGERLHLSPRTVASHLYRIFPKLDVTSRIQLSAKLGKR
ncbi:helix-turn-helix transcriptional regulator [Streptacidiphilus anmyonensis]|uniref:helix-turn-helix transcriptional regulator n=1 Tax=Streptacidiphilus anmyonensis TaxID=405782 RepID=UPI0005AA6E74|nr:LuxR family transcriptional regulator [Streptacidiphilus anmyonensis]